jgi:hypothetical protein
MADCKADPSSSADLAALRNANMIEHELSADKTWS